MALFIPITKVDVAQRLVYGTLSEEVPDKTGEILDYESAKPAFVEWSEHFRTASGGKSLGNVRAMHGSVAAGKLTDIVFDDKNRRIEGVAKIVDDDTWRKVQEGVYTGFSIGGGYARRWPDQGNPALMRYTPTLSEVSIVDNPAVPTAVFSVVKTDGSTEMRNFAAAAPVEKKADDRLCRLLRELAREHEDNEELRKHIDAICAFIEPDEGEEVEKALRAQVRALNRQLDALKKEAMPKRAVLKAVAKSDDYLWEGGDETVDGLQGQEKARALIRKALLHPYHV